MAKPYLILEHYKGLGTIFSIELFLHDHEIETLPFVKLQQRLESTITDFGNRYSRFSDDSFLTELNTKKVVPYDEDLAVMLKKAEEVSRSTNNVFSLFIKEALEEKGYGTQHKTREKGTHDHDEDKSAVRIDAHTITLLGNKGIDLGGIGKGYLIDKLARIIKDEFHIPFFLINGGGDIYVTSNHGDPVELFLEHPIHEGEYIYEIHLKNKAFCASSSFKRRWNKDGKEVNHFIAEKEVWSASYVIGDDTTTTDMYATVFCILADEKTLVEKLSATTHLEYIVICDDGKTLISKGFYDFLK